MKKNPFPLRRFSICVMFCLPFAVHGGGSRDAEELLDQVHLIQSLVDHGVNQDDSDSLALAAALFAELPIKEWGLETVPSKSSEKAGEGAEGKGTPFTFDSIYESAKAGCSNGSCNLLLERAEMAAEEQSRGRIGGVAMFTSNLGKEEVDIFTGPFRGGETARLLVAGDGDSNLDIYVFDTQGNLVCSDEGLGDRLSIEWLPEQNAHYRIEVANRGELNNNYTIISN